jgi:hypothetical protein
MKAFEPNIRMKRIAFPLFLFGILTQFSCTSYLLQDKIREYRVDYLIPIPNECKNRDYYYKSALDYRPVLKIRDSIAFFDIYTQIIDKDGHERIIDTLYPIYSYYCKELGDAYQCKNCPPFTICDCWKCADSSKELSIFKGNISEIYINRAGQFVCTFLDTAIKSKVTIELINKDAEKIENRK